MAEAVPWIVAGRYEVGEVVGRGGYGMVRRALDRKTGQTVAIKLLAADSGKDPHLVERMLREQQAMEAMAGTCAVKVLDLCRLSSGAPCLVMEWLEGRDLERQLTDWEAEGKPIETDLVLQITRPLCDTLQHAHELGIVHRDVKPANVFLMHAEADTAMSERVRLLDFGLSRMRSAAPLTAVGMVMGSPSYIPPETWRGNSALIDHRADLYSLAVIVFRMLAGRLPFESSSLIEKLQLVTTGERPSVCVHRAELPATMDDWMKRALAIEPGQRFQSAREFYDALSLALSGAPFAWAEDELSGVRDRAALGDAAPHEHRNVLAIAWERATSLLHRFIGQKASPAVPPPAAAAPPAPVPAAPPPSAPTREPLSEPETAEAAAELESILQSSDRPSVAWLDDQDLEDAPDSAMPAAADIAPAPAPASAPAPAPASAPAPSPAAETPELEPPKKAKKSKAKQPKPKPVKEPKAKKPKANKAKKPAPKKKTQPKRSAGKKR
jgi:serine/threonine-protein kinase